MLIKVTSENLQDLLNDSKGLVLDFKAPWCGPCRAIAPIIEELSEQFGETLNVGTVDVDEEGTIAANYGVRNIPTVLFIKGGEVKEKLVGANPKGVYESKFQALV